MLAKHAIKINGKWYKAGEEIKDVENSEENASLYTKSDINKMTVPELRDIAAQNGIDSFEEMKAPELRRKIIEKLNL